MRINREEYNQLQDKLLQLQQDNQKLQEFYNNAMELQQSDFTSLKEIPLAYRNILGDLLQHMKVLYSALINKQINNDSTIAFRNGVIYAFEEIYKQLQQDQPNTQNATLLTRKKIEKNESA